MLDVSILQGTFAFFKLYELLVGLNISVSNEKSRTDVYYYYIMVNLILCHQLSWQKIVCRNMMLIGHI